MLVHAGRYKTEDNTQTTQKANNAKHSRTKLARFSHLIRHSARKRDGLVLQRSRDHTRGVSSTSNCKHFVRWTDQHHS